MINSAMGESVALLCAPELQRLVVIPRASLGDIYLLEADGTPVVRASTTQGDFRITRRIQWHHDLSAGVASTMCRAKVYLRKDLAG